MSILDLLILLELWYRWMRFCVIAFLILVPVAIVLSWILQLVHALGLAQK